MKIAYLLLCHKNDLQINHLLGELTRDGSDCYIHIDSKSSLDIIIESSQIKILPDSMRIDVGWARNSMVRATLNLVEYLMIQGKEYDYVCLLSGQDYPIKSATERQAFFDKNNGLNFIEILDHSSYLFKRYSKRNAIYYPDCLYKRDLFHKLAKKVYIYLTGGYKHTNFIFRRKNTSGIHFEYGSQWWCLTFECINWMYTFVKEHVSVDYFDHSLTPDECFFQSVFMMSPFKNKHADKIMYLEWIENKNNPRLIKKEDYANLLKLESFLFARKFDFNVDKDIICALDNHFNSKENI